MWVAGTMIYIFSVILGQVSPFFLNFCPLVIRGFERANTTHVSICGATRRTHVQSHECHHCPLRQELRTAMAVKQLDIETSGPNDRTTQTARKVPFVWSPTKKSPTPTTPVSLGTLRLFCLRDANVHHLHGAAGPLRIPTNFGQVHHLHTH